MFFKESFPYRAMFQDEQDNGNKQVTPHALACIDKGYPDREQGNGGDYQGLLSPLTPGVLPTRVQLIEVMSNVPPQEREHETRD